MLVSFDVFFRQENKKSKHCLSTQRQHCCTTLGQPPFSTAGFRKHIHQSLGFSPQSLFSCRTETLKNLKLTFGYQSDSVKIIFSDRFFTLPFRADHFVLNRFSLWLIYVRRYYELILSHHEFISSVAKHITQAFRNS